MLTAEITGRIGKVPKLVGGERRAPVAEGRGLLAWRRGDTVVPRRCWAPACPALRLHGSRPSCSSVRASPAPGASGFPAASAWGGGGGCSSVFLAWSVSVSRHPNVFSCSSRSSQDSPPCPGRAAVRAARCLMKCVKNQPAEGCRRAELRRGQGRGGCPLPAVLFIVGGPQHQQREPSLFHVA